MAIKFLVSAKKTVRIFIFIILFASLQDLYAQKTNAAGLLLSAQEVSSIFSDSVLKSLNISYPIFRVYQYYDKSGKYYCILTESHSKIIEGKDKQKDTLNDKLKAVNIKAVKDGFIKIWEINDHVKDESEYSIWFWSKYIDLKDYDGDGIADPVIVYGSGGYNGYDDGRVKFILYYKGEKIAIRHQNAILDGERETQVDKNFYTLPSSLQSAIKQKMELITKNNQAIFPSGWQAAMKNKKLLIR